MGHIEAHGGRFVTVIPHGRREDTWFRDWARTHAPAWAEAHRCPGARHDDHDKVWRTFQAPAPSADGYRVIWVHSSGKAARDAATRAARIEAGLLSVALFDDGGVVFGDDGRGVETPRRCFSAGRRSLA